MDWLVDYRKAVKEYARDYVLENTSLKVLALLITAVLWLSVASRPVSQVALNAVPIEFHNWPESPTLSVSKYDTITARVYLEGPRDVLDALRGGQFVVVANMAGVEPGVRVIRLEVDPKNLPTNVRVKAIEPPSVRVTVERVIEREVPITPRFEGQPPPGFEVIDWHVTPETVKIAGAESQVSDITEVSTESVRLSDRTEFFVETVAIDIGSPGLTISSDSLKVTLAVNIGEVRSQRVITDVPVVLVGAPSRLRALPRAVSVTLYGPRSVVEALKASDLSAIVEYQAGARAFAPSIKLPPDDIDRVTVRAVEPQRVRIR